MIDNQIVGIVAIFFAVELDKAELPMETDYLLIAFVAFHFLSHLVLSILMCSSDMRKDKARHHYATPTGCSISSQTLVGLTD